MTLRVEEVARTVARMHSSERASVLAADLVDRHGRLFSEELAIPLRRGGSRDLFCWLVASRLLANRIHASSALRAARALNGRWSTAAALAASTWSERVAVLTSNGYARYDFSMANGLGALAERLVADHRGDLRELRRRAEGDEDGLRRMPLALPGIGPVGCGIFLREAQVAWPEVRPYADARALARSREFGLGEDVGALATLAPGDGFPRLIAALARLTPRELHAISDGENSGSA